jgi:hypothetical protein
MIGIDATQSGVKVADSSVGIHFLPKLKEAGSNQRRVCLQLKRTSVKIIITQIGRRVSKVLKCSSGRGAEPAKQVAA